MYKIIEIKNGKESVKMINILKVCRKRIESLNTSARGTNIKYKIVPADENEEKFKAKKRDNW